MKKFTFITVTASGIRRSISVTAATISQAMANAKRIAASYNAYILNV
jgi:hypothetical protein